MKTNVPGNSFEICFLAKRMISYYPLLSCEIKLFVLSVLLGSYLLAYLLDYPCTLRPTVDMILIKVFNLTTNLKLTFSL